jgi:predicted transcriptional regulator
MEFLNSINGHMINKIDPTLDQRMVNHCDMKTQCKLVFEKYLNKHLTDLNEDSISKEKIKEGRKELTDLRKIASKEDCNICFDEVSDIFQTHVDLVNSLKIYEAQDESNEQKILDINEKEIVKNTLDPIANVQRLKILKSIAIEPQTFSSLSKLTNLRGGNLFFHLQKLQNSDLIFQKQDHGEYLITKKGFNTINTVNTLNNLIN